MSLQDYNFFSTREIKNLFDIGLGLSLVIGFSIHILIGLRLKQKTNLFGYFSFDFVKNHQEDYMIWLNNITLSS